MVDISGLDGGLRLADTLTVDADTDQDDQDDGQGEEAEEPEETKETEKSLRLLSVVR